MRVSESKHGREDDRLAEAIEALAKALKNDKTNAVLQRIAEMECNIMSKISEYSDRVNASFDAIGASVDAIVTSVAGVAGDVTELKRIIAELQTNPGPISAEDQALLDALEVKVGSLVTRADAVKTAVAELDAQTENVPTPPAP